VACLVLAGCSDDSKPADSRVDMRRDGAVDTLPVDGIKPCTLAIATINGRSVASITALTGEDDQSASKAGIQIDVDVTGAQLPDGEDVKLNVTGAATDLTVKAKSGHALFSGVTIGSELTTAALKAFSANCSGDSISLAVKPPPECTFIDPLNEATLGPQQDEDKGTATFEYKIKILTKNASGGKVTLKNSTPPDAVTVDANGLAEFDKQILNKGVTTLEAEVQLGTVKRSCTAKVTVITDAPLCKPHPFTPKPIAALDGSGKDALGKKQDANPATAEIETNLEVESDPGNDVSLFINDVFYKAVKSNGGVANFDLVKLPDSTTASPLVKISATCSQPVTGQTVKAAPSYLIVDSKAPDQVTTLSCAVTSNRKGDVSCSWTNVADAAGGTGVVVVRLGYGLDAALTATTWTTATKLTDLTPSGVGLAQTTPVIGLPLGHAYYFGVVVLDVAGNESVLGVQKDSPPSVAVDFKKKEYATQGTGWGSVLATGDFNCDGSTDLAVGDPGNASDTGIVRIYLGNANGFLANPEKAISGTVAGGRFGARLAALPSFDGEGADKCTDLAVLASHGDSKDARVFVYLGRKIFFDREDVTVGAGAERIYNLPATAAATERLGGGLASAGDFDGDGASDLLVSYLDTATDAASVLVLYGDKTLTLMGTGKSPVVQELPAAAGVQITGGKATESFGLSLGGGAQLDADAYADLLIGAKDASVSGTKRGAAYVVKGAARAATLPEVITLANARVVTIVGGSSNSAFGTALGYVGDVNKDGEREVAISDPGVSSGAGAVYLFNLKTPPASVSDAVGTVVNNVASAASDAFGAAVACAATLDPITGADLNGDGYPDLVAASTTAGATGVGAAYEIAGGGSPALETSKATYTFTGPAAAPSFAATVLFAKDVNGDGFVDVIIGDPQYSSGKGRFFLYY